MIPATAIGRMMSVCTIDWENPFRRRVMTKTQASGSARASAPSIAVTARMIPSTVTSPCGTSLIGFVAPGYARWSAPMPTARAI
jgi:hypothetical protein